MGDEKDETFFSAVARKSSMAILGRAAEGEVVNFGGLSFWEYRVCL